ncbi:hypothetical protein JN06_00842 [Bacteroides zoogleoformans]|uniref:Uncharacterized protein n=1 Tax=Bacteroides zoogleoformans TaxID=28119 RepID=A0ABM6T9P2_9BACE|nr:hypothetical protein [Bacteroides zoogleoformans]AVM53418.1 hypothetical protein C4H11_11180 [Bacteroides zoogleoformans]TWJ17249.1 hypothetical protein JN06_00842 [Bacteroides zoogleoformans]
MKKRKNNVSAVLLRINSVSAPHQVRIISVPPPYQLRIRVPLCGVDTEVVRTWYGSERCVRDFSDADDAD